MLNLQDPIFTQAAVLDVLPKLTAKALQNWMTRELIKLKIQNPGRQAKRYYNAYTIIVLAIMVEMSDHKVSLTDAMQIGLQVADRAASIINSKNWSVGSLGIQQLDYERCDPVSLERHLVARGPRGAYIVEVDSQLDQINPQRKYSLRIYTVIETDVFIMDLLNTILVWLRNNND